jgi:hypothetical protein
VKLLLLLLLGNYPLLTSPVIISQPHVDGMLLAVRLFLKVEDNVVAGAEGSDALCYDLVLMAKHYIEEEVEGETRRR